MLRGWTRRSRKYARRSNCLSPTLTCTRRSASTLPEECYFVGLLVCPLKLTYDKLATDDDATLAVAGTGKTMLVKAVAHHTTASFIRVVGSEFVQKYLGEGPRMVRDVFRLARENSPAIIFIDEIDAIATKRFDAQTGADREVQRILLELLNQMDSFDQGRNVKVGSLPRSQLFPDAYGFRR